jgi:hypothetical protein
LLKTLHEVWIRNIELAKGNCVCISCSNNFLSALLREFFIGNESTAKFLFENCGDTIISFSFSVRSRLSAAFF